MRIEPLLPGAAIAAGLATALAIGILGVSPRIQGGRPAAAPAVTFQPGARQAYRLAVESTLRFASGEPEDRRPIEQLLTGTLHLRVLDPGPEGARVALQLAEASLTLGGASSGELDRQLGRPFLVTFARDGAPSRFEHSPATGDEARMVLQETLRTFQAIVPSGAGTAWSTEEGHASGRYRASYRFTTDGRILKTKVAYLDPEGAEGEPGMRVAVRRAEATIRIEPAVSWLARMVVEEELGASLTQGLFSSSSLRARLDLIPVEPGLPLLELDGPGGSYRELAARLAEEPTAPPTGLRPPPVESRGLTELVRALDAKRATSAALLYELRDLLVRDPAAPDRIVGLLRAGVADRTAAALLNALGMAATDEAQAALREVMAEPAFGRMNRARAALALGGASEIGDDSLAALRALAGTHRSEGLADTAVLSLGMAGDTLRQGGSPRYAELREELTRRALYRPAEEAATALLALGNTHDPSVAEAVTARLEDASSAARAAAAHALGKLGTPATPERLAERLVVEPDGTVRFRIASALNALPPPTAAALALVHAAVTSEPESQTRYELARLLGENLGTYPAARETLATLAKSDPSSRIRVYATSVVWGRGR